MIKQRRRSDRGGVAMQQKRSPYRGSERRAPWTTLVLGVVIATSPSLPGLFGFPGSGQALADCGNPIYTRITKTWDRTLGGSGHDTASCMIATPDGGVILAGTSASDTNIGGGKSENRVSTDGFDYWVVKLGSSSNIVWDNTIGGTGDDQCRAIAATTNGGVIIAGTSRSGATGDKSQGSQGWYDYWIVKLDSDGNKVWDKDFGGFSSPPAIDDDPRGIAIDTNGNIVVAGFSNCYASGDKSEDPKGGYDYWILKLTSSGAKIWDKTYGGTSNDTASGVAITTDGGIVVAGTTPSDISGDKTEASRGKSDYWIVKLDSDGNKVWDRTYGGTNDDQANAIAATPDGGVVVAGQSLSGISSDKTEAARGLLDYWVVKLDSSGNKVWDKTYGGVSNDYASAVQVLPNGEILVAGSSLSDASGDKTQGSHGATDFWLLKLTANGNLIWDRVFGAGLTNITRRSDDPTGIAVTTDGKAAVAGSSNSPASGDKSQNNWGDPNQDYWVVKFDADVDCDGLPDFWEDTHGSSSTNNDASADSDSDGVINSDEYKADTDAGSSSSYLHFSRVQTSAVTWIGGIWATQYVDRATSLQNAAWSTLLTNKPPTTATNTLNTSADGTGAFYRLRAVR